MLCKLKFIVFVREDVRYGICFELVNDFLYVDIGIQSEEYGVDEDDDDVQRNVNIVSDVFVILFNFDIGIVYVEIGYCLEDEVKLVVEEGRYDRENCV